MISVRPSLVILTASFTLSTIVIEEYSNLPSILKTRADSFMVNPCRRRGECPEISTDLLTWKEYKTYRKNRKKYFFLNESSKAQRYIKTVYRFPKRKGFHYLRFYHEWTVYFYSFSSRHKRSSLRTIMSLNYTKTDELSRKKCHKYAMFKVTGS